MTLIQDAKLAYKSGGIKEVAIGGLNYIRRPIEKQTIERTRFEIPYYVRKHNKRAKRITNFVSDKGIGQNINEIDLIKYKSSDTVFILGSGSSITQISDDKWDHIDQHDSIGLNRWPIHEFIPTYHVFETRMDPEYEDFTQTYWKLLDRRQKEYSQIPIILKGLSSLYRKLSLEDIPNWLIGKLILSCDSSYHNILTPASPSGRNETLLQYLYNRGQFQPGKMNVLYRKRGSISYLIHLALYLGYNKIVLCGVDMVDSAYFFDENNEYYKKKNIPIPRTPTAEYDNHDDSEPHKTNDLSAGKLTLEKIIYSLNDLILESYNVDLYVENTKSALYPRLPVYEQKI
jgi:hypothetical protein